MKEGCHCGGKTGDPGLGGGDLRVWRAKEVRALGRADGALVGLDHGVQSAEAQSLASAIQRQLTVAMAEKSIQGSGLRECRAKGLLLTRASRMAAPRAVEVWTEPAAGHRL